MKNKYFNEIIFIVFTSFSFLLFSFLINSNKDISNKKNSSVIVLTSIGFIDSIFEKVISYIEPSSVDQFSYNPKKINLLIDSVKDLYGVNLTKNSPDQLCNYEFFRTSRINTCIGINYWKTLSGKNWEDISKKYNIKYLITEEKINTLNLCNTYDISDLEHSKYTLVDKKKIKFIYQYDLSNANKLNQNCKLLKIRGK